VLGPLAGEERLAGQPVGPVGHGQLPGRHHAGEGHPGCAAGDPEPVAQLDQGRGGQLGRVAAEEDGGDHGTGAQGPEPELGEGVTVWGVTVWGVTVWSVTILLHLW